MFASFMLMTKSMKQKVLWLINIILYMDNCNLEDSDSLVYQSRHNAIALYVRKLYAFDMVNDKKSWAGFIQAILYLGI